MSIRWRLSDGNSPRHEETDQGLKSLGKLIMLEAQHSQHKSSIAEKYPFMEK